MGTRTRQRFDNEAGGRFRHLGMVIPVVLSTLVMHSRAMAQDLDRSLSFEAISLTRWEKAGVWPDGPARSAWAYFIEPMLAVPNDAENLKSWLNGPRYPSRWNAYLSRQGIERSINQRCRNALIPQVASAMRLDRWSSFYEELIRLDPLHAESWRGELRALATRELASLKHLFGRHLSFYDDPGSSIVIDQLTLEETPHQGDLSKTILRFSENQRQILVEQKRRWKGWESVWNAWIEYRREEGGRSMVGLFDDDARIWDEFHDGIERVIYANQSIVRLNSNAASFALDQGGCGFLDHASIQDWIIRGLVDPEQAMDCLGWKLEIQRRRAVELHESFKAFREPESLEEYMYFCSRVSGTNATFPNQWEGINARWKLGNEIREAAPEDDSDESDDADPDDFDVATWALGGLVLTEMPQPDLAWPWLRRQIDHDESLERVIEQHFQDQRERIRENAETIREVWYRQTYDPAEPQSGELFLASLDEGHLATGRFIDQLRRDAPQQTEAIRTCLLAFGIERSRRTAGLSLSAGRYKYLVPRFFTGLLSSGLDEKQVLELATREVRLLAAKTLAHQRLILEEFNTLRILLQQIGQDRDEEDYQAIEAQQQALSEMALALVEDLWSGVDRIARGLPDPERQAYMAWIINDLGGEWAGNPATWCMEAGATLIEQDSDLLKSLQSIEARITGLEAKIIRKNARAALANEASQERIVRDFHALGDARLRLLGDLATLLRSTHDGVGAENLPPQWQLIEMIDSRPRAVWRTLHDSIDRVIRVTDGEDEE